MSSTQAPAPVTEPFGISRVADRYLLFDVDVIAHCRRVHNICGMLVGTIPNLSQQNIFLGVPLELMPEEARVLVEKGAAYIVDDVEAHQAGFMEMSREDRLQYMAALDRQGEAVAKDQQEKSDARKDKALKEKGLIREVLEKKRESGAVERTAAEDIGLADSSTVTSTGLGFIMKGSAFSDSLEEIPTLAVGLGFIMKGSAFSDPPEKTPTLPVAQTSTESNLFEHRPASPSPSIPSSISKDGKLQKHYVTPTTSYPPLEAPAQKASKPLPSVPVSYPLFRYLHSRGFFHMPGLRFGCHYNVYPGDPLRYHSHFAATGLGWNQEFDLLDVVGGGRLGTGTKKAYMIGGEDPEAPTEDGKENVRAFSVEWAAL